MIRRMTLSKNQKLTAEQIAEIRDAAKRPIVPDEDAPELTEQQLQKFAIFAKEQRKYPRSKTIALHVTPDTFEKAKKLGDKYPSILSRLLDMALDNPEMVRRCL